jgi:hypothetical protein
MKSSTLFNTTKLSAITLAVIFSANVSAVPITYLYNTGVDDSGALLGDYADDTHYTLTSVPSCTTSNWTLPASWPISSDVWCSNDLNSRWISPATTSGNGPIGSYTYRITFNLVADALLSSVSINGRWGLITLDPIF